MPSVPQPGDASLPHVTVIIPVKDRREQMLRCLDAALALDYPHYDLLVADNGSTDGTPEACRERASVSDIPFEVKVFDGSLGEMRNRAVEHARGEIVAFTDSDCLPQPGWLRAGVARFARDPQLGVVQGRTLPETSIEGARWPATIQVEGFSGRYEGANLLFRREALVDTGGFDEVVGHFWEDTAAGLALKRAGWRVAFEPDALVFHDVTFPGYTWHLRRAWKQSHVGPVLAQYPELRKELFWLRIFQRPRSALLLLFAAGLVLGSRHRAALLLTLPYLWLRFPRYPHPRAVSDFAELVAFDTVNVAGAFVGAAREGKLLL
jgi:cellulose synthase/poly-beta-1,6-N-acetylglucosamine synthase-like glycosyltransferase